MTFFKDNTMKTKHTIHRAFLLTTILFLGFSTNVHGLGNLWRAITAAFAPQHANGSTNLSTPVNDFHNNKKKIGSGNDTSDCPGLIESTRASLRGSTWNHEMKMYKELEPPCKDYYGPAPHDIQRIHFGRFTQCINNNRMARHLNQPWKINPNCNAQ